MAQTFLVAIDGTTESERALDHAAEIAVAMNADIDIVHAVHPDIYKESDTPAPANRAKGYERDLVKSVQAAEARGREALEDAVDSVPDEVSVTSSLLYGNPVNEIVDYATNNEIDAIYVGHRGESIRNDHLVGSVAQAIVQRAQVPVTVVR
ncbi:universal stress protein [Salinarchaeum sp. IM2453]|uniref:universal stress protein n=1 Tax=Salinarchaeum sp. IM2453 TaxID=2862870 RepID=UPI001C833C94|nr:universal stress protein [Salinarchaeum sp. IM2453]QZA89295.1 universal stress protein [Salinarchaeum sp. IM2453]